MKIVDTFMNKSMWFNELNRHVWIVLMLVFIMACSSITCSDSQLSSTEAARAPVTNITVTNVTSTTIDLEWSVPNVLKKGVTRVYHVFYFLERVVREHAPVFVNLHPYVEPPVNYTVRDNKFQLSQLHSNRNYTITITACVKRECAPPSAPIHVLTAIGLPGEIYEPDVSYTPEENNFKIDVSWSKPEPPSGPIDYYEIIGAHYKGPSRLPSTYRHFTPRYVYAPELLKNPKHFYFKTNTSQWTIENVPVPHCNDHENIHAYTTSYICIRGINKNPLNPASPYYGPWSDPELLTTRCTVGFDGIFDH